MKFYSIIAHLHELTLGREVVINIRQGFAEQLLQNKHIVVCTKRRKTLGNIFRNKSLIIFVLQLWKFYGIPCGNPYGNFTTFRRKILREASASLNFLQLKIKHIILASYLNH